MNILNYFKNIKIGKNNYIEPKVTIYKNVTIGNNNKIYNGTKIYPNTIIGNNNVILNNNILGEHAVEASEQFKEKVFNGLEIGDNNYLHVDNLIFSGYYKKTKIGNNNKLLSKNYISHDTIITNNVVLYPKASTAGLTVLMPYSTIGMNSVIQQKVVLGSYSMVGMGSVASHNIFPFYIYFDNKYVRLNKMKIPAYWDLTHYDLELRHIITELKRNFDNSDILLSNNNLPLFINDILREFLILLNIKKI